MQAFVYHSVVRENGVIEIPHVPLRKGQKIEVIILPEDGEGAELMAASESSLRFWDNPVDDEVWNDV